MKIYTMTLNPAYDVHAWAEEFIPFHENLAQIRSKEAGGKGLNISRALQNFGIDNTAVIVLGTENGGDYKKHLSDSGMDCVLFEKEGRIRENLTLHCAASPETRISFSGFSLDETIFPQIKERIAVDEGCIVTFTGRVPDGIEMEQVKLFLLELEKMGARIVVDSRSFSLDDLYEVKPWLVKPNQEEISAFFNCEVKGVDDAIEKAKEMTNGGIANVVISLGAQGAILAAEGKVYAATTPDIPILSTIGAGDSSIAGFLAATKRNEAPEECLKWAMAFGTAACLTEGSLPPEKNDIEKIYQEIAVSEVV